MSFMVENLSALVVALVSTVIVWLYGGTRGDLLTPVAPWLILALLEVLAFFPQRHEHETTYEARSRVWKALKRDPLVVVILVFMFLLAIPFGNYGLCKYCDRHLIATGLSAAPSISILPFCVSRIEHLNVFWWFAIVAPAVLVVRHSLVSQGKRLVVAAMVINAAVLAVFGFVEAASGALGPYWMTHLDSYYSYGQVCTFFATFGYANMGGSYFVIMFGLSVAMWRDSRHRYKTTRDGNNTATIGSSHSRIFWKRNIYLIPAVLCFYAAISTLSRAAIVMAVVSAAIYAYHTFASMLKFKHRADRVRMAAVWLVGFIAVMLLAVCYLPTSIQKEVNNINTVKVLDRVSGRNNNQTRVAWKLFLDHKLFGCGGWGYRHLCRDYVDDKELHLMHIIPGSMNVHNDYLQFLAEHGLAGLGLLITIVIMLLIPVGRVWRDLSHESLFLRGSQALPRPRQIFALPAPAFMILVACLCPLIHAFGDCPLRSPAVLLAFFVAIAAIPGFLSQSQTEPSHHHHHHHHHHHLF